MHIGGERGDRIKVRVVSTTFVVVTLGVFKPFGLGQWEWKAGLHLLAIWVMGIGGCMLTDALLKYLFKMPSSTEKGVGYILRRNLCFQLVNTLLVSTALCFYRHFFLSSVVEGNRLSWDNFFETLLIIAFCSFVIGLYWRFRFRSQYLVAELEETKRLNEAIKYTNTQTLTQSNNQAVKQSNNQTITLSGSTSESITLSITDLLYIESVGNYVKVYYLCKGEVRSDMLRATSKQMEETMRDYPTVVRCHRAFLVNLAQVEKISSQSGTMQLVMQHTQDSLPVSRANTARVKSAFNIL